MKNDFIKFLSNYGCKHSYTSMLLKHRGVQLEETNTEKLLEIFCNSTDPNNYIASAFAWNESVAGYEFWNNIDIIWTNKIIKQGNICH